MHSIFIPKKPEDEELLAIRHRWIIHPELGIIKSKAKVKIKEIGYVGSEGYVYLGLNRKGKTQRLLRRTHLVWWEHYGEWPKQLIDHENRNRTDDRILNLKLSTPLLNGQNKSNAIALKIPKLDS